jgi:hypothetical protein
MISPPREPAAGAAIVALTRKTTVLATAVGFWMAGLMSLVIVKDVFPFRTVKVTGAETPELR